MSPIIQFAGNLSEKQAETFYGGEFLKKLSWDFCMESSPFEWNAHRNCPVGCQSAVRLGVLAVRLVCWLFNWILQQDVRLNAGLFVSLEMQRGRLPSCEYQECRNLKLVDKFRRTRNDFFGERFFILKKSTCFFNVELRISSRNSLGWLLGRSGLETLRVMWPFRTSSPASDRCI